MPDDPRHDPKPEAPRARSGSERRRPPADLPREQREQIRAYPGTLTFHDLIRKNKRSSVLLIIAMILLGTLLGAAIGGAVGPTVIDTRTSFGDYRDRISDSAAGRLDDRADGPSAARPGAGDAPAPPGLGASLLRDLRALLPAIALGALVAACAGGVGAFLSYTSGANAILRMSHAIPLRHEDDPELFNVVDEMRIAAGIPMPKIYLIGDSAMNAFATGRDPKHGVVAITKGLREKLTRDELQGVMAHELAHIRHYDIRFAMLMAVMVGLIAVFADGFLRALWYGGRAGGRSRGRGGGGGVAQIILLVIALLLAILAPIVARIIQMSYSRQREYLADAGAVELTRNPEGLAGALRKLAGDEDPQVDTANRGTAHMYIVNPLRKMRRSHQTRSSIFSSHPPVQERIARLLALTR